MSTPAAAMVAVVPVRGGQLPAGGAEAAVEAGGEAVVIGDGVEAACDALAPWCRRLHAVDAGPFAPARWAAELAPLVRSAQVVILPVQEFLDHDVRKMVPVNPFVAGGQQATASVESLKVALKLNGCWRKLVEPV